MYKLFVAIVFAFAFMACQGDGAEDQMSQNPSMQQDPQQENPMQQQEPATQIEVSDEELENFVDVSSELQEVQMGSQQEMIAVVEEEGLSVEVYNMIAEAEQTGQSTDDLEVSSEDLENYERASEQIAEMEQEIEPELEQIIEENGMEMDRFQEINMALQQDPELQQRIQQMMQGSGTMQQQTPPTEQN
ncbi:MAG: DUF4168 domain-containing protein [Balneolaceae bacterium]